IRPPPPPRQAVPFSPRPLAPSPMYVLERSQEVPLPIEEAFAFFSDPANLARITPPWLGFTHMDHP
ncbi:MAG TPA: hypothetical protein VMK65_05330, partial [Longimicrobiales bacterium]|nr:hypothetical protein [Longimicrobiales bacterium]